MLEAFAATSNLLFLPVPLYVAIREMTVAAPGTRTTVAPRQVLSKGKMIKSTQRQSPPPSTVLQHQSVLRPGCQELTPWTPVLKRSPTLHAGSDTVLIGDILWLT
ncbi:unnamed protein product [Caretta caretta]